MLTDVTLAALQAFLRDTWIYSCVSPTNPRIQNLFFWFDNDESKSEEIFKILKF